VQYWAEMTVLGHKEPGSVWDLGRRLWSPKTNKGGAEYRIMTEPQPGDPILHLVAGVERSAPKARFLYGMSRVASPCKEVSEEPPRAGEWAGRGTYCRIDLEGYQELEPKPRMQEVEAGLSDFILDELETLEPHHYPYMKYGDGFRGRQGVYLARLTPDLYAALSTVAAVLPQTPPATLRRANGKSGRRPFSRATLSFAARQSADMVRSALLANLILRSDTGGR